MGTSDDWAREADAVRAEMRALRTAGAPVPDGLWRRLSDAMVGWSQAKRAEGSRAVPDEGPTYSYTLRFDCTEATFRRIADAVRDLPTSNRRYEYTRPGGGGVDGQPLHQARP